MNDTLLISRLRGEMAAISRRAVREVVGTVTGAMDAGSGVTRSRNSLMSPAAKRERK